MHGSAVDGCVTIAYRGWHELLPCSPCALLMVCLGDSVEPHPGVRMMLRVQFFSHVENRLATRWNTCNDYVRFSMAVATTACCKLSRMLPYVEVSDKVHVQPLC
jgi:hypothetical protein